jgi:tryptophanyl-tRNA synthetase
MSERKRVLTGDRPTGKLHLGHYVGSLQNRVKLQDEYECYFLIADLHMLTTRPTHEDIEEMRTNIREMVLDYLAVGIDPHKSTIYLQSAVHAVYEMNLIFEMLVSLPRLTRLPSLKDMARAANIDEESIPFGLIGYPVLQAADILMPRAHLVPVGKDNEAHVEITREIARRFNYLYGEVFPIPEVMLSEVPTLVGTDGQAKDEQKPQQRDLPLRRPQDRREKSARDVYRPEAHPRRYSRHSGGQPRVHLPRHLQPRTARK